MAYLTWKLVASGVLEEHLHQHSEGGDELISPSICAGDRKQGDQWILSIADLPHPERPSHAGGRKQELHQRQQDQMNSPPARGQVFRFRTPNSGKNWINQVEVRGNH